MRNDSIYLDPETSDGATPGFAAALIVNGKLQKTEFWGYANVISRIKITNKTRFRICSITKPMVAYIAMCLYKSGQLDLDEPIGHILPQVTGQIAEITTDELLTMRSGMRDYWMLAMLSGAEGETRISASDAENLAFSYESISHKSGSNTAYCNNNYFLISLVLEKITGKVLEQLLQEYVFKPFKMKTAAIEPTTSSQFTEGAIGYEKDPEGRWTPAFTDIHWRGDAGVVASLQDMISWGLAWQEGGKAFELMMEINNPEIILSTYCRGIGMNLKKGIMTFNHCGALRGWRTAFLHNKDENITTIYLSNAMVDVYQSAFDFGKNDDEVSRKKPNTNVQVQCLDWFYDGVSGLAFGLSVSGDSLYFWLDDNCTKLRRSAKDIFTGKGWKVNLNGKIENSDKNFVAKCQKLTKAKTINDNIYVSNELMSKIIIEQNGSSALISFIGKLGKTGRKQIQVIGQNSDGQTIALLNCPRGVDHNAPGTFTLCFANDYLNISNYCCRNVKFELSNV